MQVVWFAEIQDTICFAFIYFFFHPQIFFKEEAKDSPVYNKLLFRNQPNLISAQFSLQQTSYNIEYVAVTSWG